MNTYTQILRKYESALRIAIENRNQKEGQSVDQALELKKSIDWDFVATALDVLGDTNLAVQHFLETGLEGKGNKTDEGEKYLRLYGVLNSTYLQQEALCVLYQKIIPCDEKVTIESIKNLKIREIRNKIGSHSSNYNYGKESYVVIRHSLSKYTFEFMNNELKKDTNKERLFMEREFVNLKECLEEHLILIINLFDKLYEQSIKILYKNNKPRLEEELDNLSFLRTLVFLLDSRQRNAD